MKIGILGTGIVGTTLGTHLIEKGHHLMLGSRSGMPQNATRWIAENGTTAQQGTFTTAAAFGDVVFNCTMGIASLEALAMAGAENLKNKILVDVANPLDFSTGMPPRLTMCNDKSLGEEIQKMLSTTHVVKALNTVRVDQMIQHTGSKVSPDLFLCGDNSDAKQTVTELLIRELGWHREHVIDLGGIVHARSTEALLLLLVSLAMKNAALYQGVQVFRS